MSITSGGFAGSSSGSGFPAQLAGDQGLLLLKQLISENYVPGVSGWAIFRDGDAEFNNLTIRGTFRGNDFEINSDGEFFYSGTAAPGNLIQSITSIAGIDGETNAYLAGNTTYANIGGTYFAVNMFQNALKYYSAATFAGPYTEIGALRASGPDLLIDIISPTGFLQLPTVNPGLNIPNMESGNFWNLDGWHPFTLVGGTVQGTDVNGVVYAPAYNLRPDGNLALRGVVVAGAGGLAAGTTWGTITNPDYLPSTNVPVALISNAARTTLAHVYVRPNGNLQFDAAIGAGSGMWIDCVLNIQGT